MLKAIQQTADFIKEKTNFSPEIGIILGTGLGGLVNEIDSKQISSLKIYASSESINKKMLENLDKF